MSEVLAKSQNDAGWRQRQHRLRRRPRVGIPLSLPALNLSASIQGEQPDWSRLQEQDKERDKGAAETVSPNKKIFSPDKGMVTFSSRSISTPSWGGNTSVNLSSLGGDLSRPQQARHGAGQIEIATVTARPSHQTDGEGAPASGLDALIYVLAVALAVSAAWFSVHGMIVLFPGAVAGVMVMAITMETAKVSTAAWVAHNWRMLPWFWRGLLVTFVVGVAAINAMGVFSQLVSAHVGQSSATAAAMEQADTTLTARIDALIGQITDIDRRAQVAEQAVQAASERGGKAAHNGIQTQQRMLSDLAAQRAAAEKDLSSLKGQRAQTTATARIQEGEAAPIQYVAQVFGIESDRETITRWLIAMIVVCLDPFALALAAALGARRKM